MSYELHSIDTATINAARTCGVPQEDDADDTRSAWPWVLGCIGFWICVLCAVFA